MFNKLVLYIYNSQRALAEITEMIYTACLIHKGVVNMSDFDRVDEVLEGMSSGNKMATLTGDFLLANACTELARLENTQVLIVYKLTIFRVFLYDIYICENLPLYNEI